MTSMQQSRAEQNALHRTLPLKSSCFQALRAITLSAVSSHTTHADFRLMEAIASGALILVDRMYVPRPYPLIEGVHIVYYGAYHCYCVCSKDDADRLRSIVVRFDPSFFSVTRSQTLHYLFTTTACTLFSPPFLSLPFLSLSIYLYLSPSPPSLADNNNKTDIFEKLDYYRKNVEIARRLAVRGYLHSMKHHRAANLIDYVFRVSQVNSIFFFVMLTHAIAFLFPLICRCHLA
jgi:hypothetical protein